MSIVCKTQGGIGFSLAACITQLASEIKSALNKPLVERIVNHAKGFFRISSRETRVDFIYTDYPEASTLAVSDNSTFCFPIIYVVTKNSDLCEGRGPIVPHAFFFDMYQALDYMFEIPGVQGRCACWFEERYGDYKIDIQIVHESAMSAHNVNEVAYALERAKKRLSEEMTRYLDRCDILASHHQDETLVVKPKLEDYLDETRRDFIPEK